MSWSCSYTGWTSIFHVPNQIGINMCDVNGNVAPDLVSMSCSNSIRTFLVAPGTELAIKEGVAMVCEQRKEVTPIEFKYVYILSTDDHVVSSSLLEKKLKEVSLRLGVEFVDLVLLPWPVKDDGKEYNRKEKMKQIRTMRATWDVLSSIMGKEKR